MHHIEFTMPWHSSQICHLLHGRSWFEPQTSINVCGNISKRLMLDSIQLVGVTPEVNLRITQASKHVRGPPWVWNPGQMSPEVQNRGISETQGRRHQSTKQEYQWSSGQMSPEVQNRDISGLTKGVVSSKKSDVNTFTIESNADLFFSGLSIAIVKASFFRAFADISDWNCIPQDHT